MQTIRRLCQVCFLLIIVIVAASCDVVMDQQEDEGLKASGIVEVVEILVSPEVAGRVIEIFVVEGESVTSGDPLFKLEDDLIEAQYNQALTGYEAALSTVENAKASYGSAQAALESARANVEVVRLQYEAELAAAHQQYQPQRIESWVLDVPKEFDMPVWYFEKAEKISSAEEEVLNAEKALEIERANYTKVIEDASNADILAAERRLSEAQAALLVAEELKDRKIDRNNKQEMDDYIETIYDTAEAELESAQKEYDQILSDKSAEDVLEARARLIVSQERYETALDFLNELLTGEDSRSLEVTRATLVQAQTNVAQLEAQVTQAETSIELSEKSVSQAQATLDMLEIQMKKNTIRSAVSGVILTRNIEPGEIVQPGLATLTIGQLDKPTVTVYIPEDKYGQISLGETAQLSVDSYPGIKFDAVVVRIADRAEYTPRNVQTEEDRKTTVFAIKLSVNDPDGKLKPGMPADVEFLE